MTSPRIILYTGTYPENNRETPQQVIWVALTSSPLPRPLKPFDQDPGLVVLIERKEKKKDEEKEKACWRTRNSVDA